MKHNIFLGTFFALISTLFYSSLMALIKAYGEAVPLPMLVFVQSLIALAVFLPLIIRKGMAHTKRVFKTQQFGLHVLRAIASLAISYTLFYAVHYISLTSAMLLANTAPLIVPFLGLLCFSQPINHQLWLPIIIGFTGVAMVLQPSVNFFEPATLVALGTALAIACTSLIVRKLLAQDSSETTMIYFFLLSTIISGLIAIKFWQPLPSELWLLLLLFGVLYIATQYFITLALQYANPRLVTALFYANIVNATLISAIFWHTVPQGITMAGILFTITGGVLCIRAECKYSPAGAENRVKILSAAKTIAT